MRSFFISITFFCTILLSAQQQKALSLFFDSGSYVLSSLEETKLSAFLALDSITVNSITIEGYCDDVGSETDNLVLANGRANAVSEHIRSSWDIKNVNGVGKGEVALTGSENVEEQRRVNRRASVLISYDIVQKSKSAVIEKNDTDTFEGYKKLTDSLAEGDKLILRHLIFVASTTVFDNVEQSELELLAYVEYLKAHPSIHFEVHGHVCCITKSFRDARDLYTGKNNLSVARAKRIYDYFIAKGIDKSRMVYKGFGRQFPREGVDEQFNKRVEIVITKL